MIRAMQEDDKPRITLHQLLRVMIERGASDLHVTAGSPPQLRLDGSLVPLKTPPLSPVETKQLCYSVLSEEQTVRFEKNNELDLSFTVKNLSRFRANIFMDKNGIGGVFRLIPSKILTAEQQLEIENFRKRAAETRRELKELRKNLRQDAESLVFWTKVANIALMPVLVALAGLAVALVRRRRQAAAA